MKNNKEKIEEKIEKNIDKNYTLKEKQKGIMYIIFAAFFFALMNLFIKLSGDLPTIEKAFFRNVVAIIFAGGLIIKNRPKFSSIKGNFLTLNGRAIFGTIGIFCNFYAIDRLHIADASMLNKLSPFFAIIFSIFVLKEVATRTQIFCVIMALVGAGIILRPGLHNIFNFPALIGIIGGMSAGLAYTLLRKCSKGGVSSFIIVFYFSVFSCICCIPYMIVNFVAMTPIQFIFLILTGLAATGGQFSITAAYSHAKAGDISVYDYTQILFAGLMGFFVLNEIPDIFSYIGSVFIVVAGVVNFLSNKKKA
ncbi:MAG: DMT family transporter [Lachnospiraceae bacterium]|nr:DMT family transporter [Lachnospiraceae bacterium]